jgi:chromosome segregation ATPase
MVQRDVMKEAESRNEGDIELSNLIRELKTELLVLETNGKQIVSDIDMQSGHIQQLRQDIQINNRPDANLIDQIKELQEASHVTSTITQEIRNDLDQKAGSIQQLQSDLQAELDRRNKNIAKIVTHIREMQQASNHFDDFLGEMRQDVDKNSVSIQETRADLETELANRSQDNIKLLNHIKSLRQSTQHFTNLFAEIKQDIEAKEGSIQQLQIDLQQELDKRNQSHIHTSNHIKELKRFNAQLVNDFNGLKDDIAEKTHVIDQLQHESMSRNSEENTSNLELLNQVQDCTNQLNSLGITINQIKHDLEVKEGSIQALELSSQLEADTRNKATIKLSNSIRNVESSLDETLQQFDEIKRNVDYHELAYNLEKEMEKRTIADASLLEEISEAKKWLNGRICDEMTQINHEITAKNNDSFSVQLQQEMMEESNKRNASDASIIAQLEEVHKNLSHQFTTEVARIETAFAKQLHAKLAKEQETRDAINAELAGQINTVGRVTEDSLTEFHEKIDKMNDTLRNLLGSKFS